MNIVRSAILALVTLLALAPVTPLRAQDLPVVRVGKPEAAALTFMAIEIGQSVGIWKKVGIDVQGAALKGDAQIQQALTAGSRRTDKRKRRVHYEDAKCKNLN